MWARGYVKIVHCTAERDLACRGAKTREQILNPFPHAYILCHFTHLFSHATTRFQDQNPYNANKTTY